MESMKWFVKGIKTCFESKYLRQSTKANLEKQLEVNEQKGFSQAICITRLHALEVKELFCFMAREIFKTKQKKEYEHHTQDYYKAILMDLAYIFGLLGSNNDINVFDKSPLVGGMQIKV